MRFLSLVIAAVTLAGPASSSPFPQNGVQSVSPNASPTTTGAQGLSSNAPLSANGPQNADGANTTSSEDGSTTNTTASLPTTGNSSGGRYIVKVKDEASTADVLGILGSSTQSDDGGSNSKNELKAIKAFTGTFDAATVDKLRQSSSVEAIEEDVQMQVFSTQTYAPWGLQRISSADSIRKGNATALSYIYDYEPTAGSGVDIYIVDTGIDTNHSQFCGGRAIWGATFGEGYLDVDDAGHGTHVAGTAGGNMFGVAKNSTLIAVKAFGSDGRGWTSDILGALNFVYERASQTKTPSVVSMSFGGPKHEILNAVVDTLVKNGIHAVAAAGNDANDTDYMSPASAKKAITVGAANITDEMAYYSNWGKKLDIFAPGSDVISAWIDNDFAIKHDSGTSMATPHVSGAIAALISLEGNMSPSDMKKRLRSLAIKGALKGVPKGTDNYLLQLPTGLENPNPTNPDPTNPDPTNPDPTKPDPTNPDPTNPDPTKPDPTKPDPTKPGN